MNFLLRTPFFRITVAFISGIIVFQFYQFSKLDFYIVSTVELILLSVYFVVKNPDKKFKFRWLFGLMVYVFMFVLAQIICKTERENNEFSFYQGKNVFVAELKTTPIEKTKTYRCELNIQKVLNKNGWSITKGKAIAFFEKNYKVSKLLIGDKLLIRTTFNKPMGEENPDGFNYSEYLFRNGIGATTYISAESWKKIDEPATFSVRRIANIIQKKLLKIYSDFGITSDEFSVLAALTLGYTDELNSELRSDYSATGAMHILSVSGLHVGIVYFVISFLLGFLRKNRFQTISKAIFIILFLWIYAFITGLSPSVIRSALMFSFIAVGQGLERKSQIFNTVFMSAFIMLLYNPNFIFDIGFQLSYAAVISILIFQKPFTSLLPVQNRILRWLRDLFTVSVAAQLGTIPFTLYYFQQFPSYFLLTNLIAIPLSTLIIYLAMVLFIVSPFSIIAGWAAYLLKWTIFSMNYSVAEIHKLPLSVLHVSPGFIQANLILMAITGITMYFYSKKYIAVIVTLLAVLSYALLSLYTIYSRENTERIIIYASQKSLHINFIQKNTNIVYTTDSIEIKNIASPFWSRHYYLSPIFININNNKMNNYLFFMHKKIVIAQEKHWKYLNPNYKLKADMLIIGNKLKPRIAKLFENIKPKIIIIDKTITKWYADDIKKFCTQNNIQFYAIADNGAYQYVHSK